MSANKEKVDKYKIIQQKIKDIQSYIGQIKILIGMSANKEIKIDKYKNIKQKIKEIQVDIGQIKMLIKMKKFFIRFSTKH